jgi:fructokinase
MSDGYALVLGESLIDIVPEGADGERREYPGGSPMNVAVGLARLGRPTTLATWYGPDARGALIAAHLASSGVDVLPGSDKAIRTPTAEVVFDAHGSASYVFDLSWELPPLPDDARPLVAHTGSIGASLRPGADAVLAAMRALRSRATTTYDPNARPHIIGPADGVRPLMEALVETADVVKASDEDLAWLYPGTDPLDTARDWLARGPALVVLTRGPVGVVGLTRESELACPAPQVAIADTVGAGDSFMAGLIHGLWSADLLGAPRREALAAIPESTLQSLLESATRVAAVTLSRPGANPPWLAEL